MFSNSNWRLLAMHDEFNTEVKWILQDILQQFALDSFCLKFFPSFMSRYRQFDN